MVKGKDTRAARDDNEKTSRPDAMLRPGIGVNENFDDGGHAEEGKRRKPARKTNHEQCRKEMLAESGDFRGQRGIDQRQRIFLAKQVNRAVRHMPAFDLGLPRPPENGGRKNPRRERDQGLRNLVQDGGCGEHRAGQPPCLACMGWGNAGHGSGTSTVSWFVAMASPAKSAARLAARSKRVCAASAKAAATPSGSPAARLCKKVLAPGGKRRSSISSPERQTSASSPRQSVTGASSISPEFIAQIVTIGSFDATISSEGCKMKRRSAMASWGMPRSAAGVRGFASAA